MKKSLYLIVTAVFLLAFSYGLAVAADENALPEGDGEFISRGFVEADESGDAVRVIRLTFNNHYSAYAIKVDWDKTFATAFVRVRDLFVSGDSYYATFGRRAGAKVVTTTNQTAAGVPFAPNVWSSYKSVFGKNTTIWVTPGKMTGGLPADMDIEINIPTKGFFTYKIYKY